MNRIPCRLASIRNRLAVLAMCILYCLASSVRSQKANHLPFTNAQPPRAMIRPSISAHHAFIVGLLRMGENASISSHEAFLMTGLAIDVPNQTFSFVVTVGIAASTVTGRGALPRRWMRESVFHNPGNGIAALS